MLAMAFLFPMVLAAAAAAGAPLIIHLIMRTKPRRVVFPPLRFVKTTHRATVGKLKLKHLILLAMRMAAIALIAVLLARGQVRGWRRVAGESAPAAAVIVVDDSASMGYRYHGKTLLSVGKRLGAEAIRLLPAGSTVAVLRTSAPGASAAFHGDRELAARQLADVPIGFGHRSVAAALARAEGMLATADLERKELYLITDMTAEAWRDQPGARHAEGIQYTLLDCRRGEAVNRTLERLDLSAASAAVGEEVVLSATVRSARLGGEVSLRLELDGRAVDRKTAWLSAGGAASVEFFLRPAARGLLHGRVVLENRDPLEIDNVRHFTLQVGRPVKMLIVREAATVARGGQIAFLMANAVSPPSAGPAGAGWLERRTITARRLESQRLDDVDLVLFADVAGPAESQWRRLEKFVRNGGSLWVVVGPLTSPAGYNLPAAQRIMPAALKPLEQLAEPMGWQTDGPTDPLLAPFAEDATLSLSGVLCRRRFGIQSIAPDARVVLRYADATAAMVVRRAGAGTVLLWNFAPVRAFSNLAPQVEFPILARHTARALTGPERLPRAVLWGQAVSVPVPRSMPAAVATVRRGDEPIERAVPLDLARRAVILHADRLGHWTVRFTEADRTETRGFSVNPDPAESRLDPAGEDELRQRFGPGALTIASDEAELRAWRRTVSRPLDLAAPILLALLVLMAGESFFANRFYRSADVPAAAGAAGPQTMVR